ncbi:MAG TPA: SBBP repeat-containing protein [Candidatus Krumholzibacteria bacterium]
MFRTRPAILAVCLATAPLLASSIDATAATLWSKRFGTSGAGSRGFAVAADAAGNLVMAGSFNGLVNFGGGDQLAQGTDVVLACYNASGTHQWSQRFGGAAADQAYAVAFDASGNVLITGYFQQSAYFGGNNLGSAGGSDLFVARYDADGNHLWSRSFGTLGADAGCSVAADAAGNVFVTGYISGADIVVIKYTAAGTMAWIKMLGGTGYDEGLAITTDALGQVLVTGSFSGTVNFGGGDLSTSSVDEWDVFLAKYTTNGTHIWSKRFGGIDLEEGTCVRADASGNVYVAGYFAGTVSFGGSSLTSTGADVDLFLAKYDVSGNHLWSRRMGGASYEYPGALALDGDANVYLTGYFAGTANIGGTNLPSAGGADVFCAQYDPNGIPISAQRYGGAGADAGQGIALDASGNRFVTGYFNGSVDFGAGTLTASGTPDMFLAKYGQTASGVDDAPAFDPITVTAAPNPFNPTTMIHYRTSTAGRVLVTIHDVRGQLVATLVDENEPAGEHAVTWRGRDDAGNGSASGVYFARVAQTGAARTLKLVLLK